MDKPRDEMEAQLLELMRQSSPEDQQAMQQLMHWLAYEKPKDFKVKSQEHMNQLMEDIKRKNRRIKSGQRTAKLIRFPVDKKPE